MPAHLTEQETNLVRTALGLNVKRFTTRNQFLILNGHRVWDELVDRGAAMRDDSRGNSIVSYSVPRAIAETVIRNNEMLIPEIFDNDPLPAPRVA